MNTNELISRLGTDHGPVQPLPSPGHRAVLWISCSAAYLVVIVLAVILFTPVAPAFDVGFIGGQLLGILAAGLAAWAAFISVIPGYSRRVLASALLATGIWLASFVILATSRDSVSTAASPQHEWICVAMILLGGAPLVLAFGIMLKKGAPMSPVLSGVLVGMAVGMLTNFAACLSFPHSNFFEALLWHVGAVGAVILVCMLGSKSVLQWRSST